MPSSTLVVILSEPGRKYTDNIAITKLILSQTFIRGHSHYQDWSRSQFRAFHPSWQYSTSFHILSTPILLPFSLRSAYCFHISIPYGVRIVQTPHTTVHEVGYKAGVFEIRQLFVIEISKTSWNITYITKQPVHNISKMRGTEWIVFHHKCSISMPTTEFIIAVVTIPV